MQKRKYNSGVSLVLLAMGLAALLGFAALAIDMGNAFNVQNELQKATTTAALAGAAAYNPLEKSSVNMTNIQNAVRETFNLAKSSEEALASAQIVGNIQVDTDSGAVRLQTSGNAQTFFIGIIGIRTLEVNARAAALNYPNAYKVMNDLFPIAAADKEKTLAFAESEKVGSLVVNYYRPQFLSSRIQLVCTLPMVNSNGPELTVIETGDLDGYIVYVSNNPGGPWYNISSVGKSIEGGPGPQLIPDTVNEYRFFGSGSFDLQGTGIHNARYVAVVDDSIEDGYLQANKATYIDEGSFTPAAPDEDLKMEIDAIILHQHSISINYTDLSTDANGDGVIDAHNNLIGTYENPGKMFIENSSL